MIILDADQKYYGLSGTRKLVFTRYSVLPKLISYSDLKTAISFIFEISSGFLGFFGRVG